MTIPLNRDPDTRHRSLRSLTHVQPLPGSGILRPFPSASLPHIDPFVFLDTGAPQNLGDRDIFVGPHAHRGVQPVSLLFRGRIEHRDSLGNHRTVSSGGIQWLVSGAGAIHEEVLQGDDEGVFHMAQLWINVPASEKMVPAAHYALPADRIPELTSLGEATTLRLYAGEIGGIKGPAPMPTPVLVAHVKMGAAGHASIPVPGGWTAAFTVVAGEVSTLGGARMTPGDTPVFEDDGATLDIRSERGGEVLLMCGEPIAEPMATGGGFVMNSAAEIQRAFDDLQEGRMGHLEPSR